MSAGRNEFKQQLAILVASVIQFIVGNALLSEQTRGKNIIIYAVQLIVFACSFFVIKKLVLKNLNSLSDKQISKYGNCVELFIWTMFVVFVIGSYYCDMWNDEYSMFISQVRYQIRSWHYLILLLLLSYCVYEFMKKMNALDYCMKKEDENSKYYRLVISICFIFLFVWFLYTPLCSYYTGGGIEHMDAYCNSILNVSRGIPYSYSVNCIYGHYGIIMSIPMKLLHLIIGNRLRALVITIAAIGAIAYSVQLLTINRITNNDTVFTCAALALLMPLVEVYNGCYYQVYPHRVLFPSITIYLCLLDCKKCTIMKTQTCIWIVSTLAVLWNFETGVVCSGILFAYLILSYINDNIRINRHVFLYIFKTSLKMLFSIGFSYIIFNAYNLLVGGSWQSIKTYIYPIASNDYKIVELLELKLSKPFGFHHMVIILFMAVICCCVHEILQGKRLQETQLMITIASLMGLGLFTYYINRAVLTNASIICFEVVFVVVGVLEKYLRDSALSESNQLFKGAIPKLMIIWMCAMAIESAVSVGSALTRKNSANYRELQLRSIVDGWNYELPDESIASFGTGASLLFAQMNRRAELYFMDFPDMNDSGKEYIKNTLMQREFEYIFATGGSQSLLEPFYELEKEYHLDNTYTYQLFRRVE